MIRSPWIVAVLGGLLVVPAVFLLLGRHAGGDLMAVLGPLGMWIYGLVGGVLLEVLVLKAVPFQGDESTWAAEEWARVRRWHRPGLMLILFLPGLWVGALAHSPLLVTAGYLLVAEAGHRLINVIPTGLPDPLQRRWNPEEVLERFGTLAAGLLVGIGLRLLLGR